MQKVCVEHECKWIRRAKTKSINKIVALNVEWIVVMVTCLNGLLNLLFFAPTSSTLSKACSCCGALEEKR